MVSPVPTVHWLIITHDVGVRRDPSVRKLSVFMHGREGVEGKVPLHLKLCIS